MGGMNGIGSWCGATAIIVAGLVSLLLINGATSLKNLKIIAPERVRVGDSALLTCSYDLEDAQLYTIKWYFEDEEFFRYVPKKDPPHVTFPVRSIQVNVSGSNAQDVTLLGLRRDHSGRYKCEVSEDQPRYDTKLQEADLLVVDVPELEPRIAVDKQRLADGDTLRANCTSGASRPAANITWNVNGKPLNGSRMKFSVSSHVMQIISDDRQRSRSILRLDTSNLFRDNRIHLRCFAEISPVYKGSASLEIIQDGPYVASPHSHQTNGTAAALSISTTLLSFILFGIVTPFAR
ncbi:uncharacterized protein LOC106654959 [Trichogramma pretiosum]|uniref:uncharacterized protein LOC106654959 n=1 Tax=Trichogramma pretiosum TaxID=7493 RepID=UPI0006C9E3A7|nr:uncharacterized protein LOC106654959 [Trichogramma pretiosum]